MDDIFEDETVLLIKKRFTYDDDAREAAPYTYVVSKINGHWFITGRGETGKGRTWVGLVEWLCIGRIVSAKVATDFSEVVILGGAS